MKNFSRMLLLGLALVFCLLSAAKAQALPRISISGDVRSLAATNCGLDQTPYSGDKSLRVYYRTVSTELATLGQESARSNATIYPDTTGSPYSTNGFDISAPGNWGFYVEDVGTVRIYEVDIITGTSIPETLRFRVPWSSGFVNVKEFPYYAKGDGSGDDTLAIQKAINDLGKQGGGRLYFPNGLYKVSSTTEHPLPISLPSNITIEGNAAGHYGPSRIQLETASSTIFKIEGCRQRITIRDITLLLDPAVARAGTAAVLATDVANKSSYEILFSNMTFQGFDRGINVDTTDGAWQFDNVKVDHCAFSCNIGIYMDTPNSDWKITSSWFYMPGISSSTPNSVGVQMDNAGFILIQNTFAGCPGGVAGSRGDFLNIKMVANLTVVNSQCESTDHALVFGSERLLSDPLYPDDGTFIALITLIGNQFGDEIQLNHRVNFISTSNHYGAGTVKTKTRLVRVYSTGDRFCYDGIVSNPLTIGNNTNCQNGAGGFQGPGTIMFQTGQLGESGASNNSGVPSRPTVITGNAEIRDGDDTAVDPNVATTKPLLTLTAPGTSKPLLSLGQTGGTYEFKRDANGFLSILGTQSSPSTIYRGVVINGPLQLLAIPRSQFTSGQYTTVSQGGLFYCTDCAPASDCTTSGNGALAVYTGTGWRCN